MEKHIRLDQITPQLNIDCELNFEDINSDFLKYMRLFNPYGPGNTKPVFITHNVLDNGSSKIVGKNLEHIKFELVDGKCDKVMNGIAFNMAKYFDYIKQRKPFDICYTIEESKHRKSTSVQLQIKGIRIPGEQPDSDGQGS